LWDSTPPLYLGNDPRWNANRNSYAICNLSKGAISNDLDSGLEQGCLTWL